MLSGTIFFILNSHLKEILNIEIPIVYIASSGGSVQKYTYGLCILIAIFPRKLCFRITPCISRFVKKQQ